MKTVTQVESVVSSTLSEMMRAKVFTRSKIDVKPAVEKTAKIIKEEIALREADLLQLRTLEQLYTNQLALFEHK